MGIFKSIKKAVNSNTPVQIIVAEVPMNARAKLNNQYRIIFTAYPAKFKVEIFNGDVLEQKKILTTKQEAINYFYFCQHSLLKSCTAYVE